MVGRPKKKYEPGKILVNFHISLTEEIRNLIPEGVNFSEEIRNYILFKYGDPKKGELVELKKQRDKLSTELAIVNSKIAQIEKELEEQEKLQTYMKMKQLYAIWKFWNIAIESIKRGMIVYLDPDKLESVFGITLDLDRLKKDIETRELKSYDIDTFEKAINFAETYDVKYLGNGSIENEEYQKFLKFFENYKKEARA